MLLENIMIIIGKATSVEDACMDLQNRLNSLEFKDYYYINPMTITIDENNSLVHHSKQVYAIQMIKRMD